MISFDLSGHTVFVVFLFTKVVITLFNWSAFKLNLVHPCEFVKS